MSTRSLIARKKGNGWEARYHHWDGYPTALGATLHHVYNNVFEQDADAMLKYLLDDHPAGWSTINNSDWSEEPGYSEYDPNQPGRDLFAPKRPQCYCHGDRTEEGWEFIKDSDSDFCGAEYCYVIDPETDDMAVLERRFGSHGKDEGYAMSAFGLDSSSIGETYWQLVAVVPLKAPEPDWRKIEDG